MDDQVGEQGLLERGGEALDQLVGQAPDEADRVGHEVAAAVLLERAGGRVKRLEQPVVHGHVRVRERIQEGRLAGVRVPGERDQRRDRGAPLLSLRLAAALEAAQALLEDGDPPPGEPPVGLELRLAGAPPPRSRAAAGALEVLPHAAHAREVVLELGQLDLELALGRDGVLGEDVEDQLRPVDDAHVERLLEPPLLARVEVVVDDHRLRAGVRHRSLELRELPLPHVRARVGRRAVLQERADRLDAGGAHELAELDQLVVGVDARREDQNGEPALGLGPGRGIRHVTWHPARIMPAPAPDTLPPCPRPTRPPTISPRRRSPWSTSRRRAGTRPPRPNGSRMRCRPGASRLPIAATTRSTT